MKSWWWGGHLQGIGRYHLASRRARVPLVGRCRSVQGVYVVAMHSRVTLAAAVDRLVSEAVMQGGTPDELAALAPPERR
ncbi:hypothetical protein [Burkholderia sp. PU8-34]